MVGRDGFTLVEVLVAMTVLSVAVLAMAASGTLAAGLIRGAQREEAAARLAGTLLDSLVLFAAPSGGAYTDGSYFVRWAGAADEKLTLSVSYTEGATPALHTWETRSLAAVQLLPSPPVTQP